MSSIKLVHRGLAFSERGANRFAKDVVHDGQWIHPLTGKLIKFDLARRENLAQNAMRFLKNGNRIPMPDGHTIDAAANKGFWPGPFTNIKEDLYAVAEPKDPEILAGMKTGKVDAVSVNVEFDHVDPETNKYDEVFTHICLTNYPVVTRQKEFVALSMRGTPVSDSDTVYMHGDALKEALAAIAVPVDDEKLVEALAGFSKILEGTVMMDPTDKEMESLAASLTPEEQLAATLMMREMELSGKFKGGFEGCVRVQEGKGLNSDHARRLCAYIGRRAGKIK